MYAIAHAADAGKLVDVVVTSPSHKWIVSGACSQRKNLNEMVCNKHQAKKACTVELVGLKMN